MDDGLPVRGGMIFKKSVRPEKPKSVPQVPSPTPPPGPQRYLHGVYKLQALVDGSLCLNCNHDAHADGKCGYSRCMGRYSCRCPCPKFEPMVLTLTTDFPDDGKS